MSERTCSIDGCDNPHFGRGWCNKHYVRWRSHGDPNHVGRVVYGPPEERFRAKVTKAPNGCWVWTAYVNASGYGVFSVGGSPVLAHRWAYEHWRGPIPAGRQLDHQCHNRDSKCGGGVTCPHRRCVNPGHTEPVTNAENIASSPVHYGARTHCSQGHPYDEANTLVRPDGRRCLACKRKRARETARRARKRAAQHESR